ncbi:MAG: hypothetical protein GOVbin1230_45 [Prokaryotic dsDNA virus sp.]|nr:MAG: hypothetical protein GOVbin1230_45 [Prokaryotic dsDNA virus sp.]|tara:strand:+ start:6321 stop:7529 length:1209 start_codon:yes stop_codon:yes gene_type:complete
MANYAITAVDRRVVYTGSAGTGPYSFSFPILAQTDLAVYIDSTKKTLTSDYTVSLSTSTGTGSITFTSTPTTPTSSNTITIVGGRTIQRTTDFVTAGDLLASSLNTELDSLTIFNQQISEDTDRSIKAPVYDPTTIDMTLPAKATRASKSLTFDSDGNPSVAALSVASVTVSTGSAGSSASSSYNTTTGALALTIPRGDTGATGASGEMTSFTLAGSSGSGQTITNGNTVTIAAGEGITTTGGATDTVTIAGEDATTSNKGIASFASADFSVSSGAVSLEAAVPKTDEQNTFTKAQLPSTYTGTGLTLDFDTYQNFIITLSSGSNTLAAPTTEASQIGQTGVIIFIQPGSSSAGTVSLHGDYETPAAAGLTLSSTNSAYDVVPYIVKADNSILLGSPQLAFG